MNAKSIKFGISILVTINDTTSQVRFSALKLPNFECEKFWNSPNSIQRVEMENLQSTRSIWHTSNEMKYIKNLKIKILTLSFSNWALINITKRNNFHDVFVCYKDTHPHITPAQRCWEERKSICFIFLVLKFLIKKNLLESIYSVIIQQYNKQQSS